MKLKILLVCVYLLAATTVFAELSEKNLKMIQRGTARCKSVNNELTYTEYWGDSVAPENLEVICIAEKFAHQAASVGNSWLKKSAGELIVQCKEEGKEDKRIYYLCLQENLERNVRTLSIPCRELAAEKMWSEQECRHLVSYIFMKKFEKILKSQMAPVEHLEALADRISGNIWLKLLVNPVMATLFFLFMNYDVLYLSKNGSWMRVTKVSFAFGPLLLLTCFPKGGMNILSSGGIMLLMSLVVIWNHLGIKITFKRKKPVSSNF